MSDKLSPGTVCYLTALMERSEFTGQICEIAAGPVTLPDEPGAWYTIAAVWAAQLFLGRDVIVRRVNLLPICPPAVELPTMRTPVRV